MSRVIGVQFPNGKEVVMPDALRLVDTLLPIRRCVKSREPRAALFAHSRRIALLLYFHHNEFFYKPVRQKIANICSIATYTT